MWWGSKLITGIVPGHVDVQLDLCCSLQVFEARDLAGVGTEEQLQMSCCDAGLAALRGVQVL